MTSIVTRTGKGSPLSISELDANFTNLNTDKVEKTRVVGVASGDLTVTNGGALNQDIELGLPNTGVSAGTLNNSATQTTPFTVDAKGRITGTSAPVTLTPDFANVTNKPTTLAGYGITDAQATITGAASTIDTEDLTASRALASDSSGKVAATAVTATELGYLAGVGQNLQTQLDGKQGTSAKDQANGYAGLNASGKLSDAVIPDLAISDYLGEVANETAMLALTGQKGDWCTRTDVGTIYVITGNPATAGGWMQLSYPGTPVKSVAGKTGVVTLEKADVGLSALTNDAQLKIASNLSDLNNAATARTNLGLGNVDNTSDATKNSAEAALTNKTISGSSNTLSNIANASLSNSAITFGATSQALGSTVSALNGVSLGQGTNGAAAGKFTTLEATGNTTLGDASGDTLTINGTAVSIPNNLNFDSNTLFIDAANNRVGVGTSSPGQKLDVNGSVRASNSVFVSSTGSVNFNSGNDENSKIGVNGAEGALDYSAFNSHRFFTNNGGNAERLRIDSSGNLGLRQSSNSANTSVSFNTTIQNALTLDSGGRLGIGITAPDTDTLLHVYGSGAVYSTIETTTASLWAAQVFKTNGSDWELGARGSAASPANAFYLFDRAASAFRLTVDSSGNLGIGATSFGTSAAAVLGLKTGTAPSTGPADTIQLYSTDLSAGNTMLSLFTEGTPVNANTTAAATHRIAIRINGTVYYLLANTAA